MSKQARSYKWVTCGTCGASIIAGRPCDVCPRPVREAVPAKPEKSIDAQVDEIVDVIRRDFPARMTPGRNMVGPEYSGCFNSGRRPSIRVPATRTGKNNRLESIGWFVVGDESDVDMAIRWNGPWVVGPKRGKHPSLRAWKFRGRAAALEKFLELSRGVCEFNVRLLVEARAARIEAASSDPRRAIAGAMRLVDVYA